MKKIQNFYLYSYRLTGFIFLIGLISSILWYGFSILFFIGSSSWSVPVILSPNQEKVMNHLEHIMSLEYNLDKNITELKSFEQQLKDKKEMLNMAQILRSRIEQTIVLQSKQYRKDSRILKKLGKEESIAVKELSQLASNIKSEEVNINKELEYGLITKQEAMVGLFIW